MGEDIQKKKAVGCIVSSDKSVTKVTVVVARLGLSTWHDCQEHPLDWYVQKVCGVHPFPSSQQALRHYSLEVRIQRMKQVTPTWCLG
jgi:hypothetical protein